MDKYKLNLQSVKAYSSQDQTHSSAILDPAKRAEWLARSAQNDADKQRRPAPIPDAPDPKPPDPPVIAHQTRTDYRILPTFDRDRHAIAPALLDMLDADGALIRHRARGAPQACRIWLNILLAIPPAERRPGARFALDLPAEELISWCYPHRFRLEHWTRLRTAIDRQSEIYLPTGGERRRLIEANAPKQMPAKDSTMLFDVHLPPGILSRGAPIDPLALNDLGRQSAPRWRALIAVAAATWIPGITQIDTKRTFERYVWSKTAERYPVFTLADRREIAFGSDCKTHLTRAQINAAFAHLPGFVVIDKSALCPRTRKRGWRIVPKQAGIKRQTKSTRSKS